MTPEQFLNKWLPQVAEWLNVHPESLRMKDDLEAVIRAFNEEAGRCIIEEKIGHIDNWGEEMIKKDLSGYTPKTVKEIGPDNWKFFGDIEFPPSI